MGDRQKVALVSLIGAEHLGERTNVYNDTEPLGLLYIGGIAEEAGHDVRIFHPYQKANLTEDSIVKGISQFNPDILAISSMTNTFNRSMNLAEKIKMSSPNIEVVVGGDHIGTNPQDVKNYPVIDIGVYGEGEATFKEILERRPLEEIGGISYINEGGNLKINPPRQRVLDRTQLPLPIRDPEIIRVSKVGTLMYPSPTNQTGTASLLFQFGCPLGCTYCSATTLYGSKLTRSSSDFVIDEIKQLKDRFGINTAFFTDLTFNLNPKLSEELCKKLEEENLGVSWYALIRPTSPSNQPLIKSSTLEAMVSGGCTKIGFGIESFDESAIRDYHRPTSFAEDETVLREIDKLGALSKVFLILGHPDETLEYYNQVIEKLKLLRPDEVRISFLTPFPGTDLWNNLNNERSNLLLTTNYDDYTTFKPIMRMKNLTPEQLITQRNRIMKEYYSSDEFRNNVGAKISANPSLNIPFEEFASELKRRNLI